MNTILENGFSVFPQREDLRKYGKGKILNINAHIHTPYSFSAFTNLEEPFRMAVDEKIDVLGFNDFTSVKGYPDFFRLGVSYHVFPMFNIEFIALLSEEQKNNVCVNDPNNPGRTYFSGKGLRYPFVPPAGKDKFLDELINKNNEQVRQMVEKVNLHLKKTIHGLTISFEKVRDHLSRGLVRERHVAKAIRMAVTEKYPEPEKQIEAYALIFDGTVPVSPLDVTATLENEIRSRLLKKGGPAFIPEDQESFLPVNEVRDFILETGGIPCYPILLDNPKGEITGFEHPKNILADTLEAMGVYAVEFIPGRNDCRYLEEYAEYFNNRGFLVMFGTEHNTPELIPLTVSCRNGVPLTENLRKIAYHTACIIAAHQYLTSRGEKGYCLRNGSCRKNEKDNFIALGDEVIDYFQQIK